MLPFVALVAAGTAVTLYGERRDALLWRAVGKVAASSAFVALAVLSGAPPMMLVALALCALGDVLLVPKDERVFRAGVVLFLLAHLAFIVAFALGGIDLRWLAAGLIVFGALAVALSRRILPGVPSALRRAVVPYVVVITTMVAVAVGTGAPWIVLPALLFYANDVALAHHRFVRPDLRWRYVGLPMYYAAQVLFALTSG